MNEYDINPDAAAEDIDDVEAHGMREVMAGLSAAAVLAGGAAAVVAQQGEASGGGGTSSRINATKAIDAQDQAGNLARAADSAAGGGSVSVNGPASFQATTPDAGAVADVAGGSATSVVDAADDDIVAPNRGGLVARTGGFVGDAIQDVRDVRASAAGSVSDLVDGTVDTADQAVSDTRATVRQSPTTVRRGVANVQSGTVTTPNVNQVADTARAAVDSTLVLAGDAVASITGGVMNTIARVQPAVGGEVDIQEVSGWVTVSVGGQEVARAEVKDGQASLSWEAPSTGLDVTFHYTGNDLLNPTSVTL
ncbi:MAG TPA: hypothetical protein VNB94_13200 [Mycobacteriales bacterium]|nr:hypothetical protein [Mycobacteriales bacterium]